MINEEKIATEQFILSGTKRLRCGMTTGSCAAIASLAATQAALTGTFPQYAKITVPKGWIARAEIIESKIISKMKASCAVRKDAGDDPDATDSMLIFAEVSLRADEIIPPKKNLSVTITGGTGIGRVTKSGLDQKPGEYAINSVPRKMIEEAVRSVCSEHGFFGKAEIKIYAPDGAEIAKKTFNPALGIEGGISILGTSGVVEPMSEEALVDAIEVEARVISQSLKDKKIRPLIITPGNFGEDFIRSREELAGIPVLTCANFIGKSIDFASAYDFTHVIFVGHAGKFVKLAGGIFNTHSHIADCRMEIIASHAALLGAESFDIARIFECATVEAAFSVLDETGLTKKVSVSLARAACGKIARRVQGKYKFSFIMFTKERGILCESSNFNFSELREKI